MVPPVLAAVAVFRDAQEALNHAGQERQRQKDSLRPGLGNFVIHRRGTYLAFFSWPVTICSARAMLDTQVSPKSRIR